MRYWLTPQDLWERLDAEFNFDFDPCPHPRPDGFDGLTASWGQSNWVNPPFNEPVTRWVRKAMSECGASVIVLPVPRWLHDWLNADLEIRPIGEVRWRAIENPDAERKGPYRHVLLIKPLSMRAPG